MSEGTFDLNLFIKESKDVLLNPKSYFSTMKTSGGMTEPLIKAVIYGAIAGAITFLLSLLKLTTLGGSAIGIMAFIWSIIVALIGLFIGGAILLVISSICKGSTDFEANVRVTASLMVMMPINALLGFSGHLNLYFGVIISLIISLYSLWMLYNGLVQALKTNPETSKIVSYILAALVVLVLLLGIGAKRRAAQFMKDFNNTDVKEMMKDFPKN
jgi:hypothetical protein